MLTKSTKTLIPAIALSSGLLLLGCAQDQGSAQTEKAAQTKELSIAAPAGRYSVDLNHASLSFSALHLGLAPYTAHFRDYQAQLDLQPEEITKSSIRVTVNPLSIATGYVGDYKATHADSKFSSWEEDLARSDRFLMADQHPDIHFTSSAVREDGRGGLIIDGQLHLRGQSHPLQLQAQISGSTAKHMFSKKGAIGFTAQGQFKRSEYGMNFMQGPGLLGDEVTIRFEGEFHLAS